MPESCSASVSSDWKRGAEEGDVLPPHHTVRPDQEDGAVYMPGAAAP
jgi:hypothetical protein